MTEPTLAAPHSSRSVRLRQNARRVLIAVLALLAVGALVVTEENWRGKRAWENYRREGEAKGEHFDLAWFTTKPVAPEQNFFATPFLAPLLNYEIIQGEVRWKDTNGIARVRSLGIVSGVPGGDLKAAQNYFRSNTNFPAAPAAQDPAHDVLFALEKFRPVLLELRAAVKRPAAVYSLHPERDMMAAMEMFSVLKSAAQTANLHARASLEAGHPADALDDVRFVFGVAQSLKGEPALIAHFVRIGILHLPLQTINDGLAKNLWPASRLLELQLLLLSDDLLADYGSMMRGERAFGNELMAHQIAGDDGAGIARTGGFGLPRFLSPHGMLYQNQVSMNRMHDLLTLPAVDSGAHRVFPERCSTNEFPKALGKKTPYNMFAWMTVPALHKAALRFAYTQNSFDQTAVVCALERYHLKNGDYPEVLAALTPEFIGAVPLDIIGGQPLHYHCSVPANFQLYSVGWNGKDDGGGIARNKNGKEDMENGDWVWPVK